MSNLFKKITRHIWIFICNQYLVLFFTLTIWLKLYFVSTYVVKLTWSGQYEASIIFSLASLALLMSPLYFLNKYKNGAATIFTIIVTILLTIDTVYYSYFSSLPTMGLLSAVGQTGDVGPAIIPLIKWWIALYYIDIALATVFKKRIKNFFDEQIIKYRYTKSVWRESLIVIVILLVACWTLLPLGVTKLREVIDRGYDTVSTAQYYGVLSAHIIDTARFINQETVSLSTTKSQSLQNWVKNHQTSQATSELFGVAKSKNIIMVQVESLGGFVINQTINNKEITPNLNALAKTSQFFPNNRFLIGGGHTSDTDFVANTSYFPLNDAAVFVRYGQSDFTSLPKTLVKNGYSAYAYHGFNRNFWNRNVALASLGFQKFYAADSYPKGAKINMGLNDGDFLSETTKYIKEQPKPSLSYVITLSSHVPFNITDQTKELGIKTSDYPSQVGGYLENINYTDRMLGKFFSQLKADGLYDDSLIVIYGDHVPVLGPFTAGSITYNPDSVQGKEVPLIIKLPNETAGETYANKGTNLDIAPTVFDLAGVKTSQLMFGQSVFATGDNTLKSCVDQFVTFKVNGDCKTMLNNEKNTSATIIRYNQFNNISK